MANLDTIKSVFPKLSQYDISVIDSSNLGTDYRGGAINGRKMEFYSPQEQWNPNPGKPTVELLSKGVTGMDIVGEIFSHYLPSVDPVFKQAREKFISTLSKKQLEYIKGDYDYQTANGLLGKSPPKFSEWVKGQGGDAFFRGYVTGQYPNDAYTSQQKQMFDKLIQYLRE